MPEFPDGRFDNLEVLAGTLAEYWTAVYGQRDLVLDLLRGAAFLERQVDQAADELWASVDRHACPLYRTELVHPIVLAEADGEDDGILEYGDGAVHGADPDTAATYYYGIPYDNARRFPVATDLRDLTLLSNSPSAGTQVLTAGVDFVLDATEGVLRFTADPFKDPRLTPETLPDGTRVVRLYGVRAGLESRYMSRLYGAIVGSGSAESSPNYTRLVNAVLDGVATGTSAEHLYAAVEAITGVPLAGGSETVEAVTADARGVLVVTDAAVYRYAAGCVAVVAVGDAVRRGDPLVDAVRVYPPSRGIPGALTRLTLGPGFLGRSSGGTLTFEDTAAPLTVTTGVSGYTRLSFPVGGFEADAEAFFDAMHANGVAAGETLANLLDVREAPSGQPTAYNLPATLNPLETLFAHVLGASTTVVVVRGGCAGSDARVADAYVLRRLVGPHGLVLFVVLAGGLEDEAEMAGDGDEDAPGYEESYTVT